MLQKLKNLYHLIQALFFNFYYNFPSKKLTVIGITGTDGKTTTATILNSILSEAGYKTALITTIGAQIGNKFYDTGFHTTTPSSRILQKYIKKAVLEKCSFLVLEITSHALDQNRAWGIPIKIGLITNITDEHLDYHKSYSNYLKAKFKLLKISKIPIINKDDESYLELKKLLGTKNTVEYSLLEKKLLPLKMKLIGEYNHQNALAAAVIAQKLGIDEEMIKKSIQKFELPVGRMEVVYENDFKIIVDFAHTPNAFEKVLPEVKKMTRGRLIHVFGAAGKRDPYKRPHMGNSSSKYSDVIILTSEDPRGEDVNKISVQIKAGFQRDLELYEIVDRFTAIKKAIEIAKKDDIILITGKGHEKSMNIDGKKEIPWSDKDTVLKILKNN